MPYVKSIDRYQVTMCAFDDFVDPESVARVIDAFVESLDLAEMGFQKTTPAFEGRPSYPAKSLLKLYLYGNEHKIRSSRKLEEACRVNLEVRWLMECLEPDFRTISNFRKNNIRSMKKVFHAFNHKLAGVLRKGFLSVDGSKFQANNSKDNNFTASKLDDRIKWLNEHSDEYLRQIAEIDASQEELEGTFTKQELEEKLKATQERLERYEGYRKYMEETGVSQLSLIDADAKLMKSKDGFIVAYNVQTAVDSETHMIEDFQMTSQPTDHGLLASTAAEEQKRRGEITDVVADKGYIAGEDMVHCLEQGMIPHVILPDGQDTYELELPYIETAVTEEMAAGTSPEDLSTCLHAGIIPKAYEEVIDHAEVVEQKVRVSDEPNEEKVNPYGSAEEMITRAKEGYFVRDPERNLVYCPEGEILRQKSITKSGNIRYANKTACRHCKFRNQCFKGKEEWKEIDFSKDTLEKPNRVWQEAVKETTKTQETEESAATAQTNQDKPKRRYHYETRKVVKLILRPDREKMDKRKCTSEHPFGTVKRALNGGYFLLTSLIKTEGEAALLFLGYNMRRAYNLLGFGKLMSLMGAKA